MTRTIRIDPNNISHESIIPTIEIIKGGGVIAYPTETFYGLGVDALNGEAIKKIYTLKKRDFTQPLLMLISHQDVLSTYVREIPEVARRLIHKFWPGPLTLIFFAAPHLPPLLCAHTGKVAVRISSHPIAQVLVEAVNFPITSTSANISGFASAKTAEEVLLQLEGQVDLVIDGGRTSGGKPSTLVDVTESPPRLVREGAIPFKEIESYC